MPHLKELYTKYKDQGLVVLGVHTKNAGERMAAFVAEQGIDWPIALDADGKTVEAFAVDSFPDYYLVDRAGKLRVADLANAEVDRAVEALLKEAAPAAEKQPAEKQPAEKSPAEKPDAEVLFRAALADAKQTGRNVLVHVHGPG